MKRKKVALPLKIIMCAVAVYAVVSFVTLQQQIQTRQAENQVLAQQLDDQKQKNARLEEELNYSMDSEYIAQLAREKLGLVFPGETVYFDVSN